MAEPPPAKTTTSTTANTDNIDNRFSTFLFLFLLFFVAPVVVSVVLYQADEFDADKLPEDYTSHSITVPNHKADILDRIEWIGDGLLPGPEDFAYDAEAQILYTGCSDGWIKRVKIGDGLSPVVESWAYVGGRPLGLAFGNDGQLIVANAEKGLTSVDKDGKSNLLTYKADDDLKFGLTDGVDVASDGVVYFTDASYKYKLEDYILDFYEGRPHGRLMSFDPKTNRTQVLVRDLYFANGVTLSPTQDLLIFCEMVMRRCRKYHINGEKIGKVEDFINNLPGIPDNIRYDGKGRYWIALGSGNSFLWDMLMKHPYLRKALVVIGRNIRVPNFVGDGGVLEVDLEGQPIALFTDPGLHLVTGGIKIGNHLYIGHLTKTCFGRIDLAKSEPHGTD